MLQDHLLRQYGLHVSKAELLEEASIITLSHQIAAAKQSASGILQPTLAPDYSFVEQKLLSVLEGEPSNTKEYSQTFHSFHC